MMLHDAATGPALRTIVAMVRALHTVDPDAANQAVENLTPERLLDAFGVLCGMFAHQTLEVGRHRGLNVDQHLRDELARYDAIADRIEALS